MFCLEQIVSSNNQNHGTKVSYLQTHTHMHKYNKNCSNNNLSEYNALFTLQFISRFRVAASSYREHVHSWRQIDTQSEAHFNIHSRHFLRFFLTLKAVIRGIWIKSHEDKIPCRKISHEEKIPEEKIPWGQNPRGQNPRGLNPIRKISHVEKYPKRTYLILFSEICCNSRYFNVQ